MSKSLPSVQSGYPWMIANKSLNWDLAVGPPMKSKVLVTYFIPYDCPPLKQLSCIRLNGGLLVEIARQWIRSNVFG